MSYDFTEPDAQETLEETLRTVHELLVSVWILLDATRCGQRLTDDALVTIEQQWRAAAVSALNLQTKVATKTQKRC